MNTSRGRLPRLAAAVCLVVLWVGVRGAYGAKRPDPLIEQDVRTVLITADKLNVDHLEVHCIDGDLTIRGFVPTLQEKERAQRLAAAVDGVRTVKNELEVSQIKNHF